MSITEQTAHEFVASLELAVPDYPGLELSSELEVTDGAKDAYVDAGSLISFVAGLSKQAKSDVLNSTLLAQLAATKKFNRETQTKEWYAYYREVLENVGWVLESFSFSQYKAGGMQFDVAEVVVKILTAIATQNDIAIVLETIAALKGLSNDDRRVELFNRSTHSAGNGNFQIAACAEVDDVVAMKIGAFYFSTSEQVTNLLWMRFASQDTSIYNGAQTITLNDQVYSTVRKAVLDKLGGNAVKFVEALPKL